MARFAVGHNCKIDAIISRVAAVEANPSLSV